MRKLSIIVLALLSCQVIPASAQSLQEACEQNQVEACINLGLQLQPTNQMASFNAYAKACSLGSAVGCYRAAFARNWNFGKDHICPSTARKYLRESCRLGYARACNDLIDIWKFWDP